MTRRHITHKTFHRIAEELADVEDILTGLQVTRDPASDIWQALEAMRGLTWALHTLSRELRKGGAA
jgi:hypothetical protein